MILGAAHATVCAFVTKRPAAPATGNTSKSPLEAESKIEFSLRDQNMVPYKNVWVFFKHIGTLQGLK